MKTTMKDFVEYAEQHIDLEDWQYEQGMTYIGNHLPLPYDIVDAIRNCFDDFCSDNLDEDLSELEAELDEEDVFFHVYDYNAA